MGSNPTPAAQRKTFYYRFRYDPAKGIPELTNKDLSRSGTRWDLDPVTGVPIVLIAFTHTGGKKFHELTRREARRGKLLYSRIGGVPLAAESRPDGG